MNILRKILVAISALSTFSFAFVASAQIYGNVNVGVDTPVSTVRATGTIRFQGISSTTRAEMRTEASSTRAVNIMARETTMMQKTIADGDKLISARIDSLDNLLSRIQAIKKISNTDKVTITTTVQNEINTLISLKAQIDADTSTTTLKTDVKSITADYRIYALVQPQISILAAADRINQIVSLMTTVKTKLQTRITALQAAGKDTSSLTSMISDIIAKIADAQAQASAAISMTASLSPDQGNATVAASNTAALKVARADIKTGNSDLQAVRKDMETILINIKMLTPKIGIHATTTVSITASSTNQ